MELFFESRTNFSEFSGDLRCVQHQPRVHPVPLLQSDRPTDENAVSLYGTVLRDGGIFRMWYQATPGSEFSRKDSAFVGYAESNDGIEWKKPVLGLVDCGGTSNNLCNLGLHSPSVYIDPVSSGTHRYRGTGYGSSALKMSGRPFQQSGYYSVHSPDGLHWALDQDVPRWDGGDVITTVYHPGQERAISAMKYYAKVRQVYRRCIHTAEMKGGGCSQPVSALYPEEYDDVVAASQGYPSCDFYGMGMMPAGSGTVGFLWNYRHKLPYTKVSTPGSGVSDNVALFGTSDITLAYQPERGGRWMHMPGRPNFVDRTTHPWMRSWVHTASCPIEVGDEHWLYFTGTLFEHGFSLDEDWNPHDKNGRLMRNCPGGFCRIGLIRWPKHRLFGLESAREGALTVDLGVLRDPVVLKLNFTTRTDGSVRAEILDRAGCTLADSVPLTGNGVRETIAWNSGALVPASADGGRVKLRLHLQGATIFAYEAVAQSQGGSA